MVALGGSLTALAPGMSMGFSAVALPQLRPLEVSTASPAAIGQSVAFNSSARDATRLTLAHDDAAWFTTVTMASTPVGCIIAGYLNDKWGRKGAMLAVAFPGIAGWLLVALVPTNALATSGIFQQLLVGRALSGIALGMSSSPACILAGETSAPSIRGSVLCLNSLSICAGILLAYFLGAVLPGWQSVAAFGAILTGLVALVTLTLPESPVWLRNQGRFGDAEWVCSQLGLHAVDTGVLTDKEEEARKNKTMVVVINNSSREDGCTQLRLRNLCFPRAKIHNTVKV
ncbi:hypothetical protein J437_LFUL003437 [Ladona fulva]|uniref:Major facilitator superfamily (MFS) profile domain-containing protein n=1 Tax=Ladona fulva TaxID=123851 RepID=A0A8K0NVV6_LADFU|nr:hypothetical protein J437_LFUL003437 [Ladona fulva]